MKYLSIIAILFVFHFSLNAQIVKTASVPGVVKTNFTRMFPNTTVTQWESINGNYQADYYTEKNVKNSAILSADGKFIQYKQTITANDLPKSAQEYISTNFPGQKAGEIARVKESTGYTTYQVSIADKIYLFDTNGNYLGEKK